MTGEQKPRRVLREVKVTGVAFVKNPPDPHCRITSIEGAKTPTMIEHDPEIECPSCGGRIVERIKFKPGTTRQQARLWVETRQERAHALGSVWACLHCGHEEKRY